MSLLDSFNTATQSYLTHMPWNRPPELVSLEFWEFKPHQASSLLTGHILAIFKCGTAFRIDMNITMEEISAVNNLKALHVYTLIDSKIKQALRVVEDYVEDPFDKWVREVRENGQPVVDEAT
jgi:hypothetical protein